MNREELHQTAMTLIAPGKGLLAADESFGTIGRRFDAVGIESTEETRRAYRDMLFTTPGIGEYLSGVILFDETIRQNSLDGTPFTQVLTDQGIVPGIKVDQGAKDMALFPGEKITEGLDGLRERLREYREIGARFTKWRAVITIGEGIPTRQCIDSNMEALARFAALSQEAGLVPIVEPEVLIDGDHTIEQCYEATAATLHSLFEKLYRHRTHLTGTLLKTNMVLPGKESSQQANVEEIAQATVECLLHTVPAMLPGVVFLSGGQNDIQATENLNAMNAKYKHLPWELGFSYARALQDQPMKLWNGEAQNVAEAQRAFQHRARMNSAARSGKYSKEMERQLSMA